MSRSKRNFTCPYCRKLFWSKEDLEDHQNDMEHHVCLRCKLKFVAGYYLEEHQKLGGCELKSDGLPKEFIKDIPHKYIFSKRDTEPEADKSFRDIHHETGLSYREIRECMNNRTVGPRDSIIISDKEKRSKNHRMLYSGRDSSRMLDSSRDLVRNPRMEKYEQDQIKLAMELSMSELIEKI